jgi:hypothetical protein
MIDRLLRRFRARIDANQPTQTTEATKENMTNGGANMDHAKAAGAGGGGDDPKVRKVVDQLILEYNLREKELEAQKRDLNILRANVLAIRGRDVQQPSAAPPSAMDSRGEIQPHEY